MLHRKRGQSCRHLVWSNSFPRLQPQLAWLLIYLGRGTRSVFPQERVLILLFLSFSRVSSSAGLSFKKTGPSLEKQMANRLKGIFLPEDTLKMSRISIFIVNKLARTSRSRLLNIAATEMCCVDKMEAFGSRNVWVGLIVRVNCKNFIQIFFFFFFGGGFCYGVTIGRQILKEAVKILNIKTIRAVKTINYNSFCGSCFLLYCKFIVVYLLFSSTL